MTFREDIKDILMSEFEVQRKVRGMVLARAITSKVPTQLLDHLNETIHDDAVIREVQWMAKGHDGLVDFAFEDVAAILDALFRVLNNEDVPEVEGESSGNIE